MSEMDTEEFILLGGQISNKHPIYKDLAQLASYGSPWHLFKKLRSTDFKKKSTPEKIEDLLYSLGQVEFIQTSSELTKLSAIMGDSRQRFSSKGLPDVLRKLRNADSSPSPTP